MPIVLTLQTRRAACLVIGDWRRVEFIEQSMIDMNVLESDNSEKCGVEVKLDARLPIAPDKYIKSNGITLMLVKKGTARVEVDFSVYELRENTAITFAPKSTVRYLDMDGDFKCSVLSFDQDEAIEAIPRPEPAFMDFMRRYPMGMIPAQRAATMLANMADIDHFLNHNAGSHRVAIVRNIIQNILFELHDANKAQFLATEQQTKGRQDELFVQFIHLVYEYGDKEREVSFYADKLCITQRYLARILRQLSHETAKEIIDRHCVQEIKARLRTTNESIQSIAFDLRFPDQSFFTRFFKKQTGMTPKEFRSMPS